MDWLDLKFETIDFYSCYFDMDFIRYLEDVREWQLDQTLEQPDMPPLDPVSVGRALFVFHDLNHKNIVRRLREARVTRGLPQRELAQLMGISQQAVANFERDDSDPKLSTVTAYASAVGLRITHELRLMDAFDPNWKALEALRESELDSEQ